MGQRPAAEPPEPEHDQLAAGNAPVHALELRARRLGRAPRAPLRRRATAPAAIASGSCSRLDQLHAEREALLADDPADAVEPALVVVVGLAALHPRGELLDRAGQVERAAVDQPVEQLGPARQLVGQRRRRASARAAPARAGPGAARTGGTG